MRKLISFLLLLLCFASTGWAKKHALNAGRLGVQGPNPVPNAQVSGDSTVSGTLTLTGSSVLLAGPGSTVTLNGTLNGTPTGGTLNLGNLTTLTLPANITGTDSNAVLNLPPIEIHTSGMQGTAIYVWGETGAPGLFVLQDTHFDSPAVTIQRAGSTGQGSHTPTLLVISSSETAASDPVARIGGCAALSGDNWVIVWGDASLQAPGGLLDGHGKTKGNLSIDPVHRQLVAEDGITQRLSWAGGHVSVADLVMNSVDITTDGSQFYLNGNPYVSGSSHQSGTSGYAPLSGTAIYALTSGNGGRNTYTAVANQTARLALSANVGDFVYQTSGGHLFQLVQPIPAQPGAWLDQGAYTPVDLSSLHLPMNADFADISTVYSNIVTNHGATISSSQYASGFTGSGYFNGSANLTVPDGPQFNLSGSFTIEAWFNATTLPANLSITPNVVLLDKGLWESNGSWDVRLSASQIGIESHNTGGFFICSNVTVATNAWHHLKLNGNGSSCALYLDGGLIGTSSSDLTNASAPICIGAINGPGPAPAMFFNGYIDGLTISQTQY